MTDLPDWLILLGYAVGGILLVSGLIGLAWPRKERAPSQPLVSQTGNGIQSVGQSGGITAQRVVLATSKSLEPQVDRPEVTVRLTDKPRDGTPYISAIITLGQSPQPRTMDCYVVLKSLSLDGVPRDDLTQRVTEHTSRVSWSGGDDAKVGIKVIDAATSATLNIANLSMSGLSFLMAKGRIGNFKKGAYEVSLELRGSIDSMKIDPVPIIVSFEYYDDSEKQTHPHGPFTLIGRPRNEKLRLVDGTHEREEG